MEEGLISVDKLSKGSQAYFLTHFHADNICGLSSSWSNGLLFCSRTTAKILAVKVLYSDSDIEFDYSKFGALSIGVWYPLSLISPSTGAPTSVQVLAIDSLHCPGSVMYLFRGDFGHVLYTGNFRWELTGEKSEKARNMLLNALNGQPVDVLHLDNYYCNPAYNFPTRDIAAQEVIEIIQSHPEHDVIIGVNSLGKEELLLRIADYFKIKIWVWPERLHTMHLLGLPDVFTTRSSQTRVRAVPCYSFSIDTLEGLNATVRPTIGIMPSGLLWHPRDGLRVDRSMRCAQRVHEYAYSVPYSDHSCFPELNDFVRILQPSHVKAIVPATPRYLDPNMLGPLRSNPAAQMNFVNLESPEQTELKPKMNSKDFKGAGQKQMALGKSTSLGPLRSNPAAQMNFVNLESPEQSELKPTMKSKDFKGAGQKQKALGKCTSRVVVIDV